MPVINNVDSFSVTAYLNKALDLTEQSLSQENNATENDDDEILQRLMTELALQLQMQTQTCHDEIGRIGAELRAILPRCVADLGRLGLGIEGMKEDASGLLESHSQSSLAHNTVSSDTNGTGENESEEKTPKDNPSDEDDRSTDPNLQNSGKVKNNGDTKITTTMTPLKTLETLSTLHALRTNMTLTKSILTAAASWDTTMSSIPPLLTSTQTLTDAVSSLTTLEAGEKALRGMPGRSERTEKIVSIRNQIQILLKPQLLHALQKMETRLGPLQSCVRMYAALGKMESLMEEYVKSRPVSVHRLWFEFKSGLKTTSNESKISVHNGTRKNAADELKFYTPQDSNIPKNVNQSLLEEEKNSTAIDKTGRDAVLDPAKKFVEWLPTWYEAVLLLLSEERRRALIVFGGELAPEIIVKVLNECFRPILPSFKTRLAAIYPHDVQKNSSSSGSIESICVTYEATLQFLSIAYEQMVEFEGTSTVDLTASAVESGDLEPSRTKTPVQVYMMIRSIFVAIGSPFGPYQANFAQLEKKHSELACGMVSRDVHDAVMIGKTVTLASLQDSVERLTGLVPFMIPLAQAAVSRFESLNSGYRAPNTLSTIDSVLSQHVGEISIAVDLLSTTLFSNQNIVTDTFDEQQVLCALEVLKIAGSIRRDLGSFQEKTRDRLRVLAGRMGATIDQERALMDAIVKGSGNVSLIPDSLSAVDVEALLAKAVCDSGDADSNSLEITNMQRLANVDETICDGKLLFPDSVQTCQTFIRTCQTFVFDVCSTIPLRNLGNMTTLSIWREGESTSSPDSYGILPESYITTVGEHMLALLQLTKFVMDEDALQLTKFAMEGIEHVSLQPWVEFANVSNCVDSSNIEAVSSLVRGENLSDYIMGKPHHSFDEEEGNENQHSSTASAAFCNLWLDAVCSAVTGRLLERTMQIHHVSRGGCEHLVTDYNYLINVFSALGVSGHPHPLLNHMVEIVMMDEVDLRASIITSDGVQSAHATIVRNINIRVALMRGIVIK